VITQAVQLVGAVLILVAFVLAQVGRLDVSSPRYLWLNIIGSVLLAVLAAVEVQFGFLLLEVVWTVVSVHSLVRRRTARPATSPD
jgi:hypothetical protein